MNVYFKDKVVLITGAASGIGLAAAKAFAKEDAKLALVDINGEALKEAAKAIDSQEMLLLTANVSKEEDVEKYVADTLSKYGKIDVFINNAGINGPYQPIDEMTDDNWDAIMGVNVFGVVYGLKYVLRAMKESNNGGAVVNTASVGGWSGSPGASAYVASKHAVIGITKSAALEAAAYNVRVNAVAPTYVDTNMMSSLENEDETSEVKKKIQSKVPLQRSAKPSEIADLMVYLSSDRSAFMTGTFVRIDGGGAATSA